VVIAVKLYDTDIHIPCIMIYNYTPRRNCRELIPIAHHIIRSYTVLIYRYLKYCNYYIIQCSCSSSVSVLSQLSHRRPCAPCSIVGDDDRGVRRWWSLSFWFLIALHKRHGCAIQPPRLPTTNHQTSSSYCGISISNTRYNIMYSVYCNQNVSD